MSSPSASLALALKEWAAVCSALDRGVQMLLFRKGGRSDTPQFGVKPDAFALYPTMEHPTVNSTLELEW